MRLYELTEEADADIQAIARYTISKWGIEQARRYEAQLEKHLRAIGQQKARTRIFLNHRPELLVSRVEHHYVFHQVRKNQCPLILAVLHENMDLISRLRARLDS
ncbi:MAG TPA: type II toxin-antitoxin system RelE/ParE family toxin [Verrucomicrobiae bacterium]|nr:type II toxin-antitoxin system RelE/ParE family toxin [Verrucomicrobiae bacterium]